MRILLVEDNAELRMTITQLLNRNGFTVTEAQDGHEALQLLDGNADFDAVITDMRMPGIMDGVDIISHARRQNPTIAVLIMSGDLEWMSAELDHLDPPAIVIDKPFYVRDAVDALRRVTTIRQSDGNSTSLPAMTPSSWPSC